MKLNLLIPLAPDNVTLDLHPRPSQLNAWRQAIAASKFSDYSEVGTGKSLVSYLYIMSKLYDKKDVIVVMPPPLVHQYLTNFGVIKGHDFKFAILHPDRNKRHEIMDQWDKDKWPNVLFLSYQLFLKYFRTLKSLYNYKVLVADEAHAVSNTNKWFQAFFMSIYARNWDLLLMTATPTTTELVSAYGHIKLKNPKAYVSLTQFERMHCIKEGPVGRRVIVGYKDIDIINKHLMTDSIRVLAKDVLEIKDPNIFDHNVLLDRKHAQLYRKLMVERMLELGDELLIAQNAQALRQMALQIITNLQKYCDEDIVDEPVNNLLAILDSIPMKETKVIIFCHFTSTVLKLQKLLHSYNPALVYGGSDTQKNVDKFLNDPTCRAGILNFTSGGAGFNFQSVCHNVIIYEAIGSPGMIQQGIGRVHRGGQKYPVVVWMFRYAVTLSGDLMDKALVRAEDIRQAMGDEYNFVTYMEER